MYQQIIVDKPSVRVFNVGTVNQEAQMISENQQLAVTAAKRLYEKGLQASSVIRSLKKGGHALEDVAVAARQFSEIDAMLFGESWGGDALQQSKARQAFLARK
jgi:hypothetical protein